MPDVVRLSTTHVSGEVTPLLVHSMEPVAGAADVIVQVEATVRSKVCPLEDPWAIKVCCVPAVIGEVSGVLPLEQSVEPKDP